MLIDSDGCNLDVVAKMMKHVPHHGGMAAIEERQSIGVQQVKTHETVSGLGVVGRLALSSSSRSRRFSAIASSHSSVAASEGIVPAVATQAGSDMASRGS